MSVRLTLQLFGSFRAEIGNQPIQGFESDKARVLLAFLALQPGEAERREVLCALFWPELTPERARANLSQVLSSLRGLLGDRNSETPIFIANRQSVGISATAGVEVDVLLFDRLLARCREPGPSPEQQAGWRREALALYGGDFLRGLNVQGSVELDDWVVLKRERYERQALDALRQLADYYEAGGEPGKAERYARRQVELEPWREGAHRQLMRLLAHQGNRSAALGQYEQCRRALADVFGVEPDAPTIALYKRIRDATPFDRHNLLPPTTTLIGRERELAVLLRWVSDPNIRLITITGLGGVGKTRLARALARHYLNQPLHPFPDGIYVVSLANLDDPANLYSCLADTFDLQIRSEDSRTPRRQLLDFLQRKQMLLLLDNFEQLLPETEAVTAILHAAAAVQVVVTSRERLRLHAEHVLPLEGLPYGEDSVGREGTESGLAQSDAARLFLNRVARVQPEFLLAPGDVEPLRRICQLVEGIPLALELAATWVDSLSLAHIVGEIEKDLDFVATDMGDVAERHRSMRAVFDASWQRLTPQQKKTLAYSSTFRGGFTHEAAEAVAYATIHTLDRLVYRSLLHYNREEDRYHIHRLLRQFAISTLLPEHATQAHDRHLRYYTELAEREAAELKGAKQMTAMQSLRAEHDNLRAALAGALRGNQVEQGARIVVALWLFWFLRGDWREGRQWAQHFIARRNACSPTLRGRLLHVAASFCFFRGDFDQAQAFTDEGLALSDAEGDRWWQVIALHHLGLLRLQEGADEDAEMLLAKALQQARDQQDKWLTAVSLNDLCVLYIARRDVTRALASYEEGVKVMEKSGELYFSTLRELNVATCLLQLGEHEPARTIYERCLSRFQQMGYKQGLAGVHEGLARIAILEGQHRRACELARKALAFSWELGYTQGVATCYILIAEVATQHEHYEVAVLLLAVASKISTFIDPDDQQAIHRIKEALQSHLAPAAFSAAWAKGLSLSLEQAMAHGQETLDLLIES